MNETLSQFTPADPGDELTELAVLHLDGRLDPTRHDRLNLLLSSDPRHRDLFVAVCTHASLLASGLSVEGEQGSDTSDSPPVIAPLPTTHYPLSTNFVGGPVFSYVVASVVLCLALLGAWAYKITHGSNSVVTNSRRSTTSGQPELIFVGRVTGMKDCEWSDPNTGTYVGASASLGREYALASGLMEITYKSGARVILEGPCKYKVESSSGGFLERGKLTALIVHQGPAASATGAKPQAVFAVKTPTAVITDLGTEFGVEVAENGDTTSHVFQGSIKVRVVEGLAASAASGAATEIALRENESVRVSRVRETHHNSTTTEKVRFTHPTQTPKFVRDIHRLKRSYLDLADIVAGGDGFGDARGRGIDAEDGQLLLRQPDEYKRISRGDGRCHAVEELPFIDCVFIPNGGGLMPLDSAGHTTSLFPKTDNTSWNYIWAGQIVHKNKPENTISCWLDFVDYASPRHSAVSIPPNKGITFDLNAIRRANPGVEIVRFTAVAGNAETRSENRLSEKVSADLWVFVDGENCFQKTGINATDGALIIDVILTPNNRFLSLASTDGGNSTDFDWTLFGDPHLQVKTTDGREDQTTSTSPREKEEHPME